MNSTAIRIALWFCGFYFPQFRRNIEDAGGNFPGQCLTILRLLSITWVVFINISYGSIFTYCLINLDFQTLLDRETTEIIAKLWGFGPMLTSCFASIFFHSRRTELNILLAHVDRDVIHFKDKKVNYFKFYTCCEIVALGLLYYTALYLAVKDVLNHEPRFLYSILRRVLIGAVGFIFMVIAFSFVSVLRVCQARYEYLSSDLLVSPRGRRIGQDSHCAAKDQTTSIENWLSDLEKSLSDTRDFLDEIMHVFEWPLFLGILMAMQNGVIGLYLVLNVIVHREELTLKFWYSACITVWSLSLLLRAHSSADSLNNAKKKLASIIRRCLVADRHSSITGLRVLIEVETPHRFSLGEVSGLGLNSLTNTMAFVFSYVIVALQFRSTETGANSNNLA
ncbi:Gustatory receptor 150 [Hyalella azteca]|uniref:Gustatory receptor 150 n=1 Tax=Hyalella azteca TaxID=294128 RepID=A0A6A0H1W5_HYAAZ|nr:Gustatory receptor 150 [Hyalella azteca]